MFIIIFLFIKKLNFTDSGVNKNEHYGMHSLRSTLATNMLVSGAALPVISQTLGHLDPKSTEIYLRTDMQGLMQCALDPDEGYGEVSV